MGWPRPRRSLGSGPQAWFLVAAAGMRLDRGARRWPRTPWWLHATAAGLVFGAWWPLWQLVANGTLAPRRYTYPELEGFHPHITTWLGEVVRRIPETFVGSLGLEEHPAPLVVTIVVSVLLLAAIARAGVALRSRSLVLLAPTVTALAMMAYASWGAYTRSAIPSGLRGRYLMVGIVGLLVLVGTGLRHALRSEGARSWRSSGAVWHCTPSCCGRRSTASGRATAPWRPREPPSPPHRWGGT